MTAWVLSRGIMTVSETRDCIGPMEDACQSGTQRVRVSGVGGRGVREKSAGVEDATQAVRWTRCMTPDDMTLRPS
jgi:hypothetical protein